MKYISVGSTIIVLANTISSSFIIRKILRRPLSYLLYVDNTNAGGVLVRQVLQYIVKCETLDRKSRFSA